MSISKPFKIKANGRYMKKSYALLLEESKRNPIKKKDYKGK